jgi:hypothetical protein
MFPRTIQANPANPAISRQRLPADNSVRNLSRDGFVQNPELEQKQEAHGKGANQVWVCSSQSGNGGNISSVQSPPALGKILAKVWHEHGECKRREIKLLLLRQDQKGRFVKKGQLSAEIDPAVISSRVVPGQRSGGPESGAERKR